MNSLRKTKIYTFVHAIYKSIKFRLIAWDIRHNKEKGAKIEMPHLKILNFSDAKAFYKYYWYAENIQYHSTYHIYIQLFRGGYF